VTSRTTYRPVADDATAGSPSPRPEFPRARISGIDVARALAIVGMFAVHIGPTDAEGLLGYLYAAPHGRASMLFVLVAGVGVSLLAASPSNPPGRTNLKLLWRSALLLPVGLALQELDHGVSVILQDYALLFVVAMLLVPRSDRWLLRLTALAVPLGSLGYLWGKLQAPEVFTRETIALADPAGEVAHRLVLSGPYPLITWVAPFALGLWLGRCDLRSRAVRLRLLGGGTAVAVISSATSHALVAWLGDPGDPTGWDHLVVDGAHSQMPLWLVGSTAAAVAVLGGSLLAADALPRLSRPLVLTGQLALTVYIGHLLALHVGGDRFTAPDVGPAAAILLAFTLVSILFAVGWRAVFDRGPLELLLHLPWMSRPTDGRAVGPDDDRRTPPPPVHTTG
jgi:uncharacterized membrane protein YeiB